MAKHDEVEITVLETLNSFPDGHHRYDDVARGSQYLIARNQHHTSYVCHLPNIRVRNFEHRIKAHLDLHVLGCRLPCVF